MATNEKKIDPGLLDELLKAQDPQKVFQQDGLLGELKKALAERVGPARKRSWDCGSNSPRAPSSGCGS